MTLNEFIRSLEVNSKKKEFYLLKKGKKESLIRTRKGLDSYCPITFMCKIKTDNYFYVTSWRAAAKELNLKETVAKAIVTASDKDLTGNIKLTPYLKGIRTRLLKALDLKEAS